MSTPHKRYRILKSYESPFGRCHAGVIHDNREWQRLWFPNMKYEDFDIKTDWFELIVDPQPEPELTADKKLVAEYVHRKFVTGIDPIDVDAMKKAWDEVPIMKEISLSKDVVSRIELLEKQQNALKGYVEKHIGIPADLQSTSASCDGKNALESKIVYKPTTDKVYDGPELKRFIGDEMGQWAMPSAPIRVEKPLVFKKRPPEPEYKPQPKEEGSNREWQVTEMELTGAIKRWVNRCFTDDEIKQSADDGWNIRTVKRISDNSFWSLGDDTPKGKISMFSLPHIDATMYVHYDLGGWDYLHEVKAGKQPSIDPKEKIGITDIGWSHDNVYGQWYTFKTTKLINADLYEKIAEAISAVLNKDPLFTSSQLTTHIRNAFNAAKEVHGDSPTGTIDLFYGGKEPYFPGKFKTVDDYLKTLGGKL